MSVYEDARLAAQEVFGGFWPNDPGPEWLAYVIGVRDRQRAWDERRAHAAAKAKLKRDAKKAWTAQVRFIMAEVRRRELAQDLAHVEIYYRDEP